MENKTIACACGCGLLINKFIDYGNRGNPSQIRERKFVHGHNRPWLGRKLPDYMVEMIRKRQTGRKQSEETIEKRRKKLIGKWAWNKGLKYKQSKPAPKGELHHSWKGGPPKCKICNQLISRVNASGYCGKHTKLNKRENHYNWKGGITSLNEIIRKSNPYKAWRKAVFERDDYTCVNCGERGGKLHADHIKPFSLYLDLRLNIANGRTLCTKCHKKIGWSFFRERNPKKCYA